MKDHETMRNEQADRELDLQAALIRAKLDNDAARGYVPGEPRYVGTAKAIMWRLV